MHGSEVEHRIAGRVIEPIDYAATPGSLSAARRSLGAVIERRSIDVG